MYGSYTSELTNVLKMSFQLLKQYVAQQEDHYSLHTMFYSPEDALH